MSFNWSAVSGPQDVLVGISYETNFLLGAALVILVGAIIYYNLRGREPTREAMTASTFTAMITAILGRLITAQGYSFVQDSIVGMSIVLFCGALLLLINRT